ncbi:E3 ubiquitin-protein ligase NRDP1 [Tyrophagus putrescentiae]|nr:E3 ubiquitin-protein ligase NRDP1 [Tyrophagus putrescentiae]
MSAYTPSHLEQWKSKQRALSSPLYQNVELLKNDANFQSVDELPLPPPPAPSTSVSASTNWSNQQMANMNFPPPPPEVENYAFGTDINGNQFHRESTVGTTGTMEGNLYANLPAHQVTGARDQLPSAYKAQQQKQQPPPPPPLDRSSVAVPRVPFPPTNSPAPSNGARQSVPPERQQSNGSPKDNNNSCSINSSSRPSANNNNSATNARQSFTASPALQPLLKGTTSLNSTSTSKAIQDQPEESPSAIYANLLTSSKGSTSPPSLGLQQAAFKSHGPIKSYLRVNRSLANKEEDEVDHLTDLLVKSMESSAEPDFFGMCNKCGEKVVGEGSGCTAMEMVYHIQCFTCFECNKELRGKSFYAMESNPFCEECYLNTLEKCSVCEKPILDRILRATGRPYHPVCFTCVVCKKSLDGIPFTVDASNQIHCIDDFHKKFAPRCSVCNEPIVPEPGKTETVRVVALDRSFHVTCYKCEDCDLLLSSEAEGRGCYPLDDHILCRGCNAKRVQEIST